MGFRKKSYPVHPGDLATFATHTVFLAVFIAVGYVTDWPHEWTRDGNRSRRRHQVEGRGYNSIEVYRDAVRQLHYAGQSFPVNKPETEVAANIAYSKLRLMRGAVQDAEAIDPD